MIDWEQKEWDKIQDLPWLSSDAWDAMQPLRHKLSGHFRSAKNNPQHHRLFLHAIHFRLTPLVNDMLAEGASACVQTYKEPDDTTDPAGDAVFMPLCTAVSASDYAYDPALFDLLLTAGADPFEPQGAHLTSRSLMTAAIDTPNAVRDMLRRGYPPDMLLNSNGKTISSNETALQHACMGLFDKHTSRYQARQTVNLLLGAGADMETPHEGTGHTPLLLAISHAQYLIGPLVRHGANIDATDNRNEGIMDILDHIDDVHYQNYAAAMKRKIVARLASRIHNATPPVDRRASALRL